MGVGEGGPRPGPRQSGVLEEQLCGWTVFLCRIADWHGTQLLLSEGFCN